MVRAGSLQRFPSLLFNDRKMHQSTQAPSRYAFSTIGEVGCFSHQNSDRNSSRVLEEFTVICLWRQHTIFFRKTSRLFLSCTRFLLFSFTIYSIFNLGKDDDLYTTSTVIIMERLQVGDRIYIKMDLDANHGDSKIHSQEKMPSIHFVGQKISDWMLRKK